jgi:hypothetical protein
MSLCWAVLIAVFHSVKVKQMGVIVIIGDPQNRSLLYSAILQYYFTFIPIDFYEQASHSRGSQTNFTDSPLSTNGLLAILKNTLELEQRTNRNREFTQWLIGNKEDRKENQEKSEVISPINDSFLRYFHVNRVGMAKMTSHQRSILKLSEHLSSNSRLSSFKEAYCTLFSKHPIIWRNFPEWFKGTQEWEFFWLRFWNLYFFIYS